jgi:hypothetical protein
VEELLPPTKAAVSAGMAADASKPLLQQIHLACAENRLDALRWLGKHASLAEALYNGQTPLHSACSLGHLNIVRWLVEQDSELVALRTNKNNSEWLWACGYEDATPLRWAELKGHKAVVDYLHAFDEKRKEKGKIKRLRKKKTFKGEFRFEIGHRVQCNTGHEGWMLGIVVGHHYSEAGWPKGKIAPYQIELDDFSLIFAPADDNRVIRSSNDVPLKAAKDMSPEMQERLELKLLIQGRIGADFGYDFRNYFRNEETEILFGQLALIRASMQACELAEMKRAAAETHFPSKGQCAAAILAICAFLVYRAVFSY